MNGVPTAFWAHLCDFSPDLLLAEAIKLSGIFGHSAQVPYRHRAHYVAAVENGTERPLRLFHTCTGRQVSTGGIYEEGEKGDRRRLYISFECASAEEQRPGQRKWSASAKGHKDLSLIRAASLLHVLFA
uniref:Uncharacterized protein n=1 Tax=Steinernema glaseri TaxID=37863 RepID=A0A1I7Z8N2_9BILA